MNNADYRHAYEAGRKRAGCRAESFERDDIPMILKAIKEGAQ